MSTYVCFVGEPYPDIDRHPEQHPDYVELQRAADRGGASSTSWTIAATAAAGDRCIFYYVRPLSSFVASATVVKPLGKERSGYWRGHYMAQLGSIALLPRAVPLHEIRSAFTGWGWPRSPRSAARVPLAYASRLLRYLEAGSERSRAADATAIEGLKTETTRLTRSRSRLLRDLALRAANGRCESCGQDFSEIQWIGLRAPLQVHHRRQLASTEMPRTTRSTDLAAVCANCHTMIHSDPKKALSIATLRRQLQGIRASKARPRRGQRGSR